MNRHRSNLFTVINSSQNDIADGCSGQNAVFVCTVCHGISNIRRNVCRVPSGADAGHANSDRRSGCSILCFYIIGDMVKGLGSNSG